MTTSTMIGLPGTVNRTSKPQSGSYRYVRRARKSGLVANRWKPCFYQLATAHLALAALKSRQKGVTSLAPQAATT